MTATEATTNGPASSLDELTERVDTLVAEQNRTPVLSVIRGLLNETGIRRARAVLNDAPDLLGNAQESLRVAQEAERSARESYDAAVLEAEWSLGASFVVDKNRTYLVVPCTTCDTDGKVELTIDVSGIGDQPGTNIVPGDLIVCSDCGGTKELRKQLSADEKRTYIAAAVAKMPDVAKAAEVLRAFSHDVDAARDDVEIAKARLSVAKADLAASVAELETLRLAIPSPLKEA